MCPVQDKCVSWWHSNVCNTPTKAVSQEEYEKLADEFKIIALEAEQKMKLKLMYSRQQKILVRQTV